MNDNLITLTDSYKVTHWKQYPPKTERVYSYYESRGGKYDETVFFGLSYLIQKYLTTPITMDNVNEAEELFAAHFGDTSLFNREGWEHIVLARDGILPLQIKAVPEGMAVTTHNVLMTVENTDPKCWWLTNYMETLLCQLWYPITVATQSREIKKSILDMLRRTGDPAGIDFKLHDFGFRGSTSCESATIGGAAHLISFLGTDTFAATTFLRDYYDEPMAGFSIPAAEHSTITSWGKENEVDAFRNMIQQYGDGTLYAVVSDSYNIYDACRELWGNQLHDEVLNANGTLVVRPDSGNPVTTVIQVLTILSNKFGSDFNSKGYKVLNDKVRVIQGDGVNHTTIVQILEKMEAEGWSADNIAFGSGGALLQQMDRDTCKFAFKCSQIKVDGKWRPVFKDPITDPGKTSKKGFLSLLLDEEGWLTLSPLSPDDVMQTVFLNGKHLIKPTLSEIRGRAQI